MLSEKIIVNFGDSIFGNFRAPEDISSYISEITGAVTYNVGFGGCRMAEHVLVHFDAFCMYRLAHAVTSRDFSLQDEAFSYVPAPGVTVLPQYFSDSINLLKSIDFSKVDIVTIAYGTNDYTAKVAIENPNDKYDVKTFAGALRSSIEALKSAFPHVKIVLCGQLYRFWRDADGNFLSDSDTRVIGKHKLSDFIEKTNEIANDYGLFFIDNYNGSGICKDNKDLCFSSTDGTHPMPYGRRLVAENMARELLKVAD